MFQKGRQGQLQTEALCGCKLPSQETVISLLCGGLGMGKE